MDAGKKTGYPSIDKPWLQFYSEEALNTPLPECTIYEYMYENNKNHLTDIALLYFNRKISFGELFENIDKTARAFSALGVKRGDIVTVAMPSMPEALYCVYALNRLGAVANMIHPLASEKEICHYLNEVKSTVFVMFTGTYELVKNAIGNTSVQTAIVASPSESLAAPVRLLYKLKAREPKFDGDPVFLSWGAFIGGGKNVNVHYKSHDVNETAIISHTGGTTGEPKGVMCSDRNINAVIWQVTKDIGIKRQDINLVPLPPFVNYSLVDDMLAPLVNGVQVLLIPDYQPEKFDEYVRKYHPNHTSSIPAYWEALLNNENIEKTDLSCLKCIYYGGESMDIKNEEAVNQLLKRRGARTTLGKGIGSTEMVSAATATYPGCNDLASVGVPLMRVNCKIVEPDTMDELSYNQEGEICFSGPSLMIGYYNKPEATDEVVKIHADGERWLHTGDLGHVTEDGILYVTGRIKRIIMTRGNDGQVTKMFPDRIEKALLEHPAVRLCCVVGVEDERRIHYPKVFVVLNSGYDAGDFTTESILAACREKLPGYMVPDVIEYRSDLPRTSRGKVDYRALEEEANRPTAQ